MRQAVLCDSSIVDNKTRSILDMAGRIDGLALFAWAGVTSTS